jgi:signal transduction histidine kinase
MRQEVPGFRIWPEYERPEYHTIAFLEPHDRRNLAALGFDMFSEPTRRAAMERARDTGLASISGPVTLVQEIEGPKQKGFLMYLPVYNDGDVPDTLEERRRQLRGFLYSPCRADDLFLGIFADYTHIALASEIYDGATLNEETLLHRSGVQAGAQPHSSQARIDLQLEVAGRLWTLVFRAQPGFVRVSPVVPATLAGGLGLTLVLLYLTLGQARARREAEDTAARLKVSEQHLLEARTELQNYALLLEKKVAERTMELSKSLEDLERVMYHVAHDLRAPARAMGSFASLALEDSRKELTPASVDYLQRIRGGAERMDALVSDLLAYGRTAHMPLPLEEVNLEDRVEQALTSVHANVQETGTIIHVDRPLPKVQANPGALTDVLRQLLTNAVKFAKPGTKPWVRIYAQQGEKIRLYVEDRGIGIRPEYHDRIFRIFERLHASDTYSGTGIGLALAHKAVERMGGSLGVESTPGEGSRFWVELPCPDKNQPNPLKTG